MSTDNKDLVEQLRFELNYLEQISDRLSAGEHRTFVPFRDNALCPNYGDPVRPHACHECLLYDFVPEAKRIEDVPCHHIVVTPEGESIKQLLDADDQVRLLDSMCIWLRQTIAQLERARNPGTCQLNQVGSGA